MTTSTKYVVGFDVVNLKCREDASSKLAVEFIIGDAHNLPFQSSSVDLLKCSVAWN